MSEVAAVKLQVNALQRVLSKRVPEYSDKLQLTGGVGAGAQITTNLPSKDGGDTGATGTVDGQGQVSASTHVPGQLQLVTEQGRQPPRE